MPIPEHRINYTKIAEDVLDIAKYKGYKFYKHRKLDSWLKLGWGTLFRRTMTDYDIKALKHFIDRKFWLDIKLKTGTKLGYEETYFMNQYIGKDGYIYMNKRIYPLEITNPKETKRLEKITEKSKEERAERFLEYEKRYLKEMARTAYIKNTYYVTTDGKIRRRT